MKTQKKSQSIRLIVQPKLKEQVRNKAHELGVNMSTYIKHLILVDLQKLPVYEASERVEKAYQMSLREKGYRTNGRKASDVLRELTK